MGKRWLICILFLTYIILRYLSTKQLFHYSILSWHKAIIMSTSTGILHVWVFFGAVLVALTLAMLVPGMVVVWITVMVLLSCSGRREKELMLEGKKLTAEISGIVIRDLIMNNSRNVLGVMFAVLGCFCAQGSLQRYWISTY